jgi:hypothetical protein
MDSNLRNMIKQLALDIKRMIDEGTSKGTIKPDEEIFFKWKVDKFQYTDRGVVEYSSHGEYITKPSWVRTTFNLIEKITESAQYSSVLEYLIQIFGKDNTLPLALHFFTEKLIHECLCNPKFGEVEIDSHIEIFLKDLRGEPVKCGAEVELKGVVLSPSKVELDHSIVLRQTRIEDLEREFPVYGLMQPMLLPIPSAILNIEFLGRGANEIRRKIWQSIAILRLFKVGSINCIKHRMYSDSLTDVVGGTVSLGGKEITLETYLITEEDVPRLREFWHALSNALPLSFFDSTIAETDYLTIAYNRYCDSLFQNGVLERRIANCVMGLEALFLKSSEVQELVYRLSFRMSKLFSLLGYDPYEVKKIVRDAYKVRNIFVHGEHLSYKEKRKIESKYKDIKNFLQPLLEYLRISIIVIMLSRREKDELIDLIDDSFVDKKREEMLNDIVSGAKDIMR